MHLRSLGLRRLCDVHLLCNNIGGLVVHEGPENWHKFGVLTQYAGDVRPQQSQ